MKSNFNQRLERLEQQAAEERDAEIWALLQDLAHFEPRLSQKLIRTFAQEHGLPYEAD